MAVTFRGKPILIQFRPSLRAYRGKLISGGDIGTAVHAASFLRDRRIILDRALLRNTAERDRILLHEIFHFVWWKLIERHRREYQEMIECEQARFVPGEMGWSAQWRKEALRDVDGAIGTRRFHEYLCESFCDSAAAHVLQLRNHPEITLPASARRVRTLWMRKWMEASVERGGLTI